MIQSKNNLRPEPGYRRAQTSTVAELRTYQPNTGSQVRLKCAKTGAWYFQNGRPSLIPGAIAKRERKGFRVVEAYWLPLGARLWRPISLADVRRVYRLPE